jgi:hypothetical protein
MMKEELLLTESLNSLTNQLINQFTNELSFITRDKPTREHHLEQFVLSRVLLCYYSLPRIRELASRWPATDYSGYQLQRERAYQTVVRSDSTIPAFRLHVTIYEVYNVSG